jgi:hypothetical protein
MEELTILEILSNSIKTLLSSKVFILVILELLILGLYLIFNKLIKKNYIKTSTIFAAVIVFGLYISNYISTLIVFLNNVTINLMELIYFPTTLEFTSVMALSFMIMVITLGNKNSKPIIKVINVALPMIISFLFLGIIEFTNVNNIAFDEFSVFTNPVLMSLHELAMGSFVAWILGLIIYKVDVFVLSKLPSEVKVDKKEEISKTKLVSVQIPAEMKYNTVGLEDVYEINNIDKVKDLLRADESELNDDLDDLELPKLKTV